MRFSDTKISGTNFSMCSSNYKNSKKKQVSVLLLNTTGLDQSLK